MTRQIALVVLFAWAGCGGGSFGGLDGGGGGDLAASAGDGGMSMSMMHGQGDGGIQAGTLTAGAWDDNLNFDFYQGYLAKSAAKKLPGLPEAPRADRMVIEVVDENGAPLPGARVTVSLAGKVLFDGASAGDGKLLFFPAWAGVVPMAPLELAASFQGQTGIQPVQAGEPAVAVRIDRAVAAAPSGMDVALVIDTTGSMQDEIDYLKVEFDAIVASIAQQFPGIDQRWGLVLYRDVGDAYVVESHDFTKDLAAYRGLLAMQMADGGGDYEESPEEGLAAAAALSWRGGAVARLAFLVGDAPQHVGREGALLEAIKAARGRAVHIYPVAASGADERFEHSMRTAAQLTGGRYLFLTNDSGVGVAQGHEEPTLPCYVVTRLDRAMVRMMSMELTGKKIDALPADVVRTGGDPMNGACKLGDGEVVLAL